jgi:hypothetical protein
MKYVIQSLSLRHGLQFVCMVGSMYRLVDWDRAAPLVHVLDDVDLKNGTRASIMRTFEARDKILSVVPIPEGWGPVAPCDHKLGRIHCRATHEESYAYSSEKALIAKRDWITFFDFCPTCGKRNAKITDPENIS